MRFHSRICAKHHLGITPRYTLIFKHPFFDFRKIWHRLACLVLDWKLKKVTFTFLRQKKKFKSIYFICFRGLCIKKNSTDSRFFAKHGNKKICPMFLTVLKKKIVFVSRNCFLLCRKINLVFENIKNYFNCIFLNWALDRIKITTSILVL